jgi:hypothetical protein
MPVGTHLGPWLIGTTKSSTGDTAALTRNTGATIVAQTSVVTTNNNSNSLVATGIWVPAGARFSFGIVDLPSEFDYDACIGNGGILLYLRNAPIDSGAKNSVVAANLTTNVGFCIFSPSSNNLPAYTRLYWASTENIANYPCVNNMSQGVNTDRQVWLTAYSGNILPTTLQVTVAYMVRNTNTTYQPSSTTGP